MAKYPAPAKKDAPKKAKTVYKENPLKKKYQTTKLILSSSSLKKKIRDCSRMLTKLDSLKQVEMSRRIEALKMELVEFTRNEKEDQMDKKYKYVKFVERKKVLRMMKSCAEPEKEGLENKVCLSCQGFAF